MQVIQALVYQYQNPHIATEFLKKKTGFTARKVGLSENERQRRIRNREPLERTRRTREKVFTARHMEALEAIEEAAAKGLTYRQISLSMGKSSDYASNFMGKHKRSVGKGYRSPWSEE